MNHFNDHTDSFEQFLKETTDSFCMMPNKKVWNSIYNNIHPGRFWPSFATNTIIVICFLFLQMPKQAHIENNQQTSPKSFVTLKLDQKSLVASSKIGNNTHFSFEKNTKKQRLRALSIKENTVNHSSLCKIKNTAPVFDEMNESDNNITTAQAQINSIQNPSALMTHTQFLHKDEKSNNRFSIQSNGLVSKQKQGYLIQVYATPSFGFLQGNETEDNLGNASINNGGVTSGMVTENKSVLKPTLNLEAGGAVMMNVSRVIRLKAGMQLNYTKLDANTSSDDFTSVSNNPTLINYNPSSQMFQRENTQLSNADLYQISVPIGTEIEIMGNDKFRWFAGATIQPSYLINAESNDVINLNNRDAVFGLRKWNLNTSFETYISYKMKNGVLLNLGPQFRYQWLSTHNQPLMSGMDKLYNVGLKLGVSRVF